MANYTCRVRTNYFRVKDPEAFRAFMRRVCGSDSPVELWEERSNSGTPIFGFGTYGNISGLYDINEDGSISEDIDDSSYDVFLDGLQAHVADDDAIIIFEAGGEKLNYIVGTAVVITSSNYDCLDITRLAAAHASGLLGNSDWSTKCDY